MKFIFIEQTDHYYKSAVDLRIALFFNEMDDASFLINDKTKRTVFISLAWIRMNSNRDSKVLMVNYTHP